MIPAPSHIQRFEFPQEIKKKYNIVLKESYFRFSRTGFPIECFKYSICINGDYHTIEVDEYLANINQFRFDNRIFNVQLLNDLDSFILNIFMVGQSKT